MASSPVKWVCLTDRWWIIKHECYKAFGLMPVSGQSGDSVNSTYQTSQGKAGWVQARARALRRQLWFVKIEPVPLLWAVPSESYRWIPGWLSCFNTEKGNRRPQSQLLKIGDANRLWPCFRAGQHTMETRLGSLQGAGDTESCAKSPATASPLIWISGAGWGCHSWQEPLPWCSKPLAKWTVPFLAPIYYTCHQLLHPRP